MAQVIVDNGGNLGAGTVWNLSSPPADLILRNGGGCLISGNPIFGNLTVGSSIAIYAPTNLFTGITNAGGGGGFAAGQPGTIFYSSTLAGFQVTSQSCRTMARQRCFSGLARLIKP